uniref:RNA-directed DNA polymerase n=1 Tax=Caenorhabditis japonica TaxID=281687 RepID=A0A8R1EKI3_CAEJA
MTDDQLCCMVWINGLRDPAHIDIRTRALQTMESRPDVTLLQLESEIKRLLDLRADSKCVAGSTPSHAAEINAIFRKQQRDNNREQGPPSACYRCGGPHWARDCNVKDVKCSKCGKTNHMAKFCRFQDKTKPHQKKKVKSVIISLASSSGASRIYRKVFINSKPLRMQLDTGADITLINTKDWAKIGKPKLDKPSIKVKSATGQPINVKGSFTCDFTINGNSATGTAHVADTDTLLGIDWISKDTQLWNLLQDNHQINAAFSVIGSACNYLDDTREKLKFDLKSEYPIIFQPGLGKCTKTKASIRLKPGAQPVFRKARPVPYATLPTITEELDRFVQEGIATPIDHAQWAAPVVPIRKKNGSLRMCADFSTGLNDAIESHQHPLPTADDIFATLNGGKHFSQIDLAEAYFQIELDEDSKNLLCINTHRGLFQFNRLPFGVKPATAIFQQVMDSMISGIEGAAAYLDDIIISGGTVEEHNSRVKAVMQRIADYGFRIRIEKCKFLMKQIVFLGFVIDEHGRRPDPEKVADIQKMPAPTNVSQLRSFLGLIQFYGAFVKELFELRPPLNELTKKDQEFIWSPKCQKAFERIKEILQSDLLLTQFDPKLPIIVAADASQYGIGSVLTHRFPDGSEKAIYHNSQALTAAQRNYSQIEKEALGLVTAVTKYHRFIHGRHFTLRTDHKPLLSIFGDKKGVPVYSANRLQRWATILLNYDFSIEYVNTHDFGQADALSRLIAEQSQSKEVEDQVIGQVECEVIANLVSTCNSLPVTVDMISSASTKDTIIAEAINNVKHNSWPNKMDHGSILWNFFNRREQLSIVKDCLMLGDRVVIPTALRHRVLKMLHRAHPGMVRMKQLARSFVYWPSLDKDIESTVRSCDDCAAAAKDPIKNTLCSWPTPTAPWTRVHADYAGPIEGTYYLVIVDSYSKWPEVIATKSITSTSTISIFRKVFAQFGNPKTLVTDNGTQFTSTQFIDFCKEHGIQHIRSPPFHPQSNGQAERFVDTMKRALRKLQGEGNADTAIQVFLQNYRSTPCEASPHYLSPAENFIGRKIRTTLDLLLPSSESPTARNDSMEAQFNRHHGARERMFQEHDKVYVKDFRNPQNATWISGVVQKRIGRTLYKVLVNGSVWKRHTNQLRRRDIAPFAGSTDIWYLDVVTPSRADNSNQLPSTTQPTPASPTSPRLIAPTQPTIRTSTRHRNQVKKLDIDPRTKSYK